MKILFAGGGTLGPVTPLLAVAEAWKKMDPSVSFVWVGTPHGPERQIIEEAGIKFFPLPVARFPRYVSIEWLLLPFRWIAACIFSWFILSHEKPTMIASAGGYTAVPVIFMGWCFKIPSWIHQQDVRPLLSNRLSAPFARCITTAWDRSLKWFPQGKTKQIGNPVRATVLKGTRESAITKFHLDSSLPTVLVMGGGGGALWINHLLEEMGPWLTTRANVIHLTGSGKLTESLRKMGGHYFVAESLTEDLADAYAAATIVVSRAGMATLTELAAWRKPAIVIPLPRSPQEDNANVLKDTEAAIVLSQSSTSAAHFQQALQDFLLQENKQRLFSERMGALLATDVAEALVHHVRSHLTS